MHLFRLKRNSYNNDFKDALKHHEQTRFKTHIDFNAIFITQSLPHRLLIRKLVIIEKYFAKAHYNIFYRVTT